MVEIRLVPTHEGPMTVAALRRVGIEADGCEAYDVVTKRRPRFGVSVPYASVEAAESVLENLR
jgi:hypothetical protein